jgi:hypothetical protein
MMNGTPSYDQIELGLLGSVEEGYLEIVGEDKEGNSLFAVTDKGRAHIEGMLDDALEQAVSVFSEQVDIPRWLARDLLLRRAQELRELDS